MSLIFLLLTHKSILHFHCNLFYERLHSIHPDLTNKLFIALTYCKDMNYNDILIAYIHNYCKETSAHYLFSLSVYIKLFFIIPSILSFSSHYFLTFCRSSTFNSACRLGVYQIRCSTNCGSATMLPLSKLKILTNKMLPIDEGTLFGLCKKFFTATKRTFDCDLDSFRKTIILYWNKALQRFPTGGV